MITNMDQNMVGKMFKTWKILSLKLLLISMINLCSPTIGGFPPSPMCSFKHKMNSNASFYNLNV
jgi:hypothetical protein